MFPRAQLDNPVRPRADRADRAVVVPSRRAGSVCRQIRIDRPVISAGEELERCGCELVVVLEDAAMTRVGVDDELGACDPAMQVL